MDDPPYRALEIPREKEKQKKEKNTVEEKAIGRSNSGTRVAVHARANVNRIPFAVYTK